MNSAASFTTSPNFESFPNLSKQSEVSEKNKFRELLTILFELYIKMADRSSSKNQFMKNLNFSEEKPTFHSVMIPVLVTLSFAFNGYFSTFWQ